MIRSTEDSVSSGRTISSVSASSVPVVSGTFDTRSRGNLFGIQLCSIFNFVSPDSSTLNDP